MKITAIQLKAIVPAISISRAGILTDFINEVCPKYGINTRLRLAAFIAQCAHESGGFSTKTEGLNYSVEGLQATFRYYRNNPEQARKVGRTTGQQADQQAIANTVYADANRDESYRLGNTQPGDGWAFRGGGFIQLTGRGIYARYASYLKQDIKSVAANVRTTDLWALDSACWFFVNEKSLLDEADRGDIRAISRAVNGSTAGLDKRIRLYEKAKKALVFST
jgi:putative chitinase